MSYLLLIFLICSCAHGPQTENKSPLNYLNGENYQADVTVGALPISVNRLERSTLITGQCFFKNPKNNKAAVPDDYNYPVKFKRIALMKDGQILKHAVTDALGNFTINTPLSNGEYLLKSLDKAYQGQMSITITRYQLVDVKFQLNKIE